MLVGCSGGPDSLALAVAVAAEAPGRAGLISVDHGLQPGSRRRAEQVAATGATLGLVPSEAVTVAVNPAGQAHRGPEDAARVARHTALAAAAARHGAVAVVLGHTRDDQAEQVLLGLARGSGARSLAGMAASRELDEAAAGGALLLRPLLDLPRADTVAACAEAGLTTWDDPHNDDPAYARARARALALPALEQALGPGVPAALARTAALLRADADALDALAQQAHDRADALTVSALAALPAALRTRVLRLAALGAGARALTATHVAAMDALVTSWHGQGQVDIPGGVSCRRSHGVLVVVPGRGLESGR